MSINGLSGSAFDFASLVQRSKAASAASTGVTSQRDGADSFAASLKLQVAQMKSTTFETLLASSQDTDDASGGTAFDFLLGTGSSSDALGAMPGGSAASGVSASGRNMSLFDPESAYTMMTTINAKDVNYKAEFAEMSDMASYLEAMRKNGLDLGGISAETAPGDIVSRLQSFADAYNGWIQRFDQDLEPGGVLSGTQAAQVSQWELEQSVENYFNGAVYGLHGMRDLGFTIDPVSNLATLDHGRLESALATDMSGVVGTIQEFSGNFAKSAELLTSEGNFVPNRLDNLSRVIDYIGDNRQSLQKEFGLGAQYTPTGEVAKALDAYNAIHRMVA